MPKPLVSEIKQMFDICIYIEDTAELQDILKFFDWAYNEGKKEALSHRKPTKMELATT